jgi:hypothetical protein
MKKKILFWTKTVVGDFNSSHCSMHAAGLTYFSMLALVPLLCVLLSVAKICGADDFARQKINEQIDVMISNVEHAQEDDLAQVVAPVSEEERERKRIGLCKRVGLCKRKRGFQRHDSHDHRLLGRQLLRAGRVRGHREPHVRG